jgi:hypothetical protein
LPLIDPSADRLAEIINLVNPRQQGQSGPADIERKVFGAGRVEKGKPNHRRRPGQARIAAGKKYEKGASIRVLSESGVTLRGVAAPPGTEKK